MSAENFGRNVGIGPALIAQRTKSLIDFVTERPTREDLTPKCCPFCGAADLIDEGCETTLLGRLFGEGYDANHIWHRYRCSSCGQKLTHEQRMGWHWLVGADKKIITGMPHCYETYVYTHHGCGGDVHRRQTKLDGVTATGVLQWSTGDYGTTRHYRIFYDCQHCGMSIETDEDYHQPPTPPTA